MARRTTMLFMQDLITDVTGYRFAVRKSNDLNPKNILGENLILPQHYTKTELQTSGSAQVHWGNITNVSGLSVDWANISNKPTEFNPTTHNHAWSDITDTPTTLAGYGITDGGGGTDTSAIQYPTTGSYKVYEEVIPPGFCKEKEKLLPVLSGSHLAEVSSGALQAGQYYYVRNASITHDSIVYNDGDYFQAANSTYTGTGLVHGPGVPSGSLQVGEVYRVVGGSITHDGYSLGEGRKFGARTTTYTGTGMCFRDNQYAEFEDCSQLYNPIVLEVGDYYYLYYAANCQKYDSHKGFLFDDGALGMRLDSSGFGRSDQVFLAYKHKSNGIHGGKWTKYKDASQPIVGVNSDLTCGEYDVGNTWLRSVFYSDILGKYFMLFCGDYRYWGGGHTPNWAYATSDDGINWTKSLNNPISEYGSASNYPYVTSSYALGAAVEVGTKIYVFSTTGAAIRVNSTPDMVNWTSENLDIIPAAVVCFGAYKIDSKVYLITAPSIGGNSTVRLYSVDATEADIVNPASYTLEGTINTVNADMQENTTNGINYTSIFKVDTDKWAIFYSYYKNRFAAYDNVRETGLRVFTFSNTKPLPA